MNETDKIKNKLVDEQSQLFQKLYKLDEFLVSGIGSNNISEKQRNLMWIQRNAMKMYIDVLQLRINDLQEKIESEVK